MKLIVSIQIMLALSPKNSEKKTLDEISKELSNQKTLDEISKELSNQKAELMRLREERENQKAELQEQKTELQEQKTENNKQKNEVASLASWAGHCVSRSPLVPVLLSSFPVSLSLFSPSYELVLNKCSF